MRIAIASDHGGFELKRFLAEALDRAGHEVHDLGPATRDPVDYPDYAVKVARAVLAGEAERGVLCCGTGQGMAMAACKVPGIRAAAVADPFSSRMVREHNNAQVLCLGERVLGVELARECLLAFLAAEFQGGRHAARVAKIDALDRR